MDEESGPSHERLLLRLRGANIGFWTVVLLDNCGTILTGLLALDVLVESLNDGKDVCNAKSAFYDASSCDWSLARASRANAVFQILGGLGSVLTIPILGHAADKYGRKPLFVVALYASIVPALVLVLVSYVHLSIYYYFAASTLIQMLPMQTLFMLWINDSTLQKDRVKIFARLSAFQSMEGVIIPLTAKFIIGKTGVLLLVGIRCLAVMVALCFLRESRDRDTNTSSIPRHRTSCAQACVALKEIWSTLTHLGQNEAVRSIFLLGFFATGTGVATQQILFPFCKARFGVQMSGFAPVVMVETLSNAVVQFLVTPRLAKLGLRRLFALGLTMGCGNCLVFGLAPSMSVLLWLLSIAGLGSVGTPAFQTLMTTFADSASRCGDPSLQSGAILSALQAMQSLFLVFMPPLYQLIFSAFVNTPLGGGRHPEVPFLLAASSQFMCLVILLRLKLSVFHTPSTPP